MTLFRMFRTPGDPLAVSMAGIKLADRLLIVGCGDPLLVARLAVKTGLTGRAVAVDADPALIRAAEALAPREGALIETLSAPWSALPLDAGAFDVAIVRQVFGGLDAAERTRSAAEIHRVLRPGGRCLVIDAAPASGLRGLLPRSPGATDYAASEGALHVLQAAGFRAARVLADREGLVFTEAARGRD